MIKAMTGNEIMDYMMRIANGLFQNVRSIEDCKFALVMAMTRKGIPTPGRILWRTRR